MYATARIRKREVDMGLLSRMSTVVKSKMNKIVDDAENPNETLDYAYEKQLESLKRVRENITKMVTAKRMLMSQADKAKKDIVAIDARARKAMELGREDLARMALQHKQTSLLQLEGLDQQIYDMELEQEKLTQMQQRLQTKVSAFKTKKEVIKAQYSAAQAQVRIGSALSGLSEEMGDISLAIERAEGKTEKLKAKAGAIDELAEAGVLDDFSDRSDPIGRELAQLTAAANVEDELAALRSSLPTAEKKALGDGE
jgi:phage shock protein A